MGKRRFIPVHDPVPNVPVKCPNCNKVKCRCEEPKPKIETPESFTNPAPPFPFVNHDTRQGDAN